MLSDDVRAVPGERPVASIGYEHPAAEDVFICGSWSHWRVRHTMHKERNAWVLDVRKLKIPPGRHEFKFLPDGEWERGANRIMHVNRSGILQRPPDIVTAARLETLNEIHVHLKPPVKDEHAVKVSIAPNVTVSSLEWVRNKGNRSRYGYAVVGDHVTFCFDEILYDTQIPASERVTVAGTFNGWNSNHEAWRLGDYDDDGRWEGTFPLRDVTRNGDGEMAQFKFVVNGERWMEVPAAAPNRIQLRDHTNLAFDPRVSRGTTLRITTRETLSLSQNYTVTLTGIAPKPIRHEVSPGSILDTLASSKPLGVTLDKQARTTTYRLFAPRARRVDLCFFEGPTASSPPLQTIDMRLDTTDGVWEAVCPELHTGRYYAFKIDGPRGAGESFDYDTPVGDPYARAAVHEHGNSIVIDPDASNAWFAGWTDAGFKAPPSENAVIYEAHVRDLTIDDSAGVPAARQGKYTGLVTPGGRASVLTHLRALGINMVEFLPVCEFANGIDEHGWGYNTTSFFAPEASYGTIPAKGSQYYEFKQLVNDLHREGFGVILDVVYNHIGSPNVFYAIDRKYYFRQGLDFTLSNYSGCGNDVRTESPMMRRLIVENVLYWMREFHVDGFRFDLAELIDMDTLRQVEREARAVNPNILLISEPWSFRGNHKQQLKGTAWAAWNDEFREPAKAFAKGNPDREALKRAIQGSVQSWTAHPMQSVNYLESHDDMCLADELSSDPKHDARNMTDDDAARNRLAATVLMTSLGIPMIAQGQEFLRSKHGIHNTYNKGDEVNALRWQDRNRPLATLTLDYYRGLTRLRSSPEGRAFRMRKSPPADYYTWIEPKFNGALGYVVNGKGEHGGASFAVLLNAMRRPVRFPFDVLEREWVLVGDGGRIDMAGIPNTSATARSADGTLTISVPALSSRIYMAK